MQTDQNNQMFRSAGRVLVGGILGATAYIVTARIVIAQSVVDYDLGFIRHVIDVSLFPAGLLLLLTVSDKSIFYLPAVYGLSSLPYAVLGALVAVRANKIIILLVLLVMALFFCVSWVLAWIFATAIPT